MPDLKDAMSAIVGAGIGLGGLLLIFIGFLFGQAAALTYSSAPAPLSTTQRYRRLALVGLVPFGLSLIVAASAITYWFYSDCFFGHLVVFAFLACIVIAIAYGVYAAVSL